MTAPESAAGVDLTAKLALSSSSTAARIPQLHVLDEKLSQNALDRPSVVSLLNTLFSTHSFYHDRPSRRAVQKCLVTVIRSADADLVAPFVAAIRQEAQKHGIASTNAFVLLEWAALLMQHLAGPWDQLGDDVLLAAADALDRCLQEPARTGLAHSALVVARRGFRTLVVRSEDKKKVVSGAVALLTAKGSKPTAKNAALLGVVAGVCSRNADAKPVVAGLASSYLAFYSREMVGSRTPLPAHQAGALGDFFEAFATLDDLDRDVFPALEKGLLRAPEVVLGDLITPLVRSLPDFDLSGFLGGRLLKPLLASVKSSNAAVRSGAVGAFRQVVVRCRDEAVLERVADEVLGPLRAGKLASADHRVLHAEMLLALLSASASVAPKTASTLPAVVAKEGNEAALASETLALNSAARLLSNDLPKALLDAYAKGLGDKKPPFRRVWIVRAGEVLLDIKSAVPFAELVLPALAGALDETTANPLAAAQNGLVVGALVATGVAPLLRECKAVKAAVDKMAVERAALDAKTSFLLSPRVYGKLSADSDLRWQQRALSAVAPAVAASDSAAVRTAWAQAIIYMVCATAVPAAVRRESSRALSQLYVQTGGRIAAAVVDGVWDWLRALETGDKESAAVLSKAGASGLHAVLGAICLSPEYASHSADFSAPETLDAQMCSLLVLARPELVPRAAWIDLCLKVELDPGELARRHEQELLDEIVQRASGDESSVREAAFQAAAELAFIAPETMTARIVQLVRQDLDVGEVRGVGPLEAAILRTPEDTAVVDVLAKKQEAVPDKKAKDYDTLRWEEELRAQLARKKGTTKKLTADEAAKVKAQLRKEGEIRARVRKMETRLRRGFGIARALATGPPTDAILWMGPVVEAILEAIDAGAGRITGDAGPAAYMALAERTARQRLGTMRTFVGVATLRARGAGGLPENLTQEPLGELVTRVLYRLRFVSEQRPLDAVSLIYAVPLLRQVLRGEIRDPDDADTQLVLAIEMLSHHTDTCAQEAVPRAEILSALIHAMQAYSQHYKAARDCFADTVRCVAPTLSSEEAGVLARGSIVPQAAVRAAVLQAVSAEVDMSEAEGGVADEVWLASHDDVADNAELGREVWEESGFVADDALARRMLPYLDSKDAQLRRAAARGLAEAVTPASMDDVLGRLRHSYTELAQPRVPELDELGRPRKTDLSDPWESRQGIARALRELAPSLTTQLEAHFDFLIGEGPLGDANAAVREEMLEAAKAAVEAGAGVVDRLMDKFEGVLGSQDNKNQDKGVADRVDEAVVILYGALARHLPPGDAKIPVVMERLLATLSTPSETVQYAIAECLPPLVQSSGDSSPKYTGQMLDVLLSSKSYAVQRGAAYGLAGLVRGLGVGALHRHKITSALHAAAENRKDARQREAALLAYELLATLLGRLFEPYVIGAVPQLLAGLGDTSSDVREAALAAAKACFGQLSSFGVRQILPGLLAGLEDQQWRSKKGACDLLGAMAYLDPQQLAQRLPDIIPALTTVLNDSHKEVRAAANRSLKRFGDVVGNPEIRGLVGVLLRALSDPTRHTDEALDALIGVAFVHYLDAPSLALVSRVLQRGLAAGARSATKRKAAQVIGSLAHLAERRDLAAHLPALVAGLKAAAVDPVPTTRATASRALGSLVEQLGEDALPDLIPGLMQTLRSDTGAGDRLGSAQALSEVLAGLGTARLEATLPTILHNVESSRPAVREGFMSLFIFLPVCFGNSFAAYLGRIVPPILSGLADDAEPIRDAALRAGRLLVKNFSMRAVDLLLPALERGLADDSYRIRLSSVELVGDLLFNLTGIKREEQTEDEDEDNEHSAAAASLVEVLGEERRNSVLSALYVCRCDTSGAVRSAAVSVWKALVSAPPRTLRELVPTLTRLLVHRLGSAGMEHRVIASNALGELIRRAGDGVLATLLPVLERGLESSTDRDARQGICLALRELIASASPDALEDHHKTLVAVVRAALTDPDADVRDAAADAFDSLQRVLGRRAVDHVLPFLLARLKESDGQNALAALLTLLTDPTRSAIILPNLVPTLVAPPMSAFNARALAALSKVAGPAMNRRLPSIIHSLMDSLVSENESDSSDSHVSSSLDAVILSVDENDGLHTVMNVLLQLTRHDDHRKRAAAARHLGSFFAATTADYSRYNQDVVRALLVSFDDRDPDVVRAAHAALSDFTRKLRKEEMEALVPAARQALLQAGVAGRPLPGFELPRGVAAVLPIFLQGLMNGTADQRVQAALAVSDLVDRASEPALRPSVTQITGPLIRAVSERAPEVRAAILLTLNNLLAKMPQALRPFLPQLQRTFAKSLADPASDLLRARAARALGTLIRSAPRVDPLVAELVAGARAAHAHAHPGVQTAMLTALYEVVSRAGTNMAEASRVAVLGLVDADQPDQDDGLAAAAAKLLAALLKVLSADQAVPLLRNRVMLKEPTPATVLALNAVLLECPDVLLESPLADDLPDLLCEGMSNKNPSIADNLVLAAGKYLLGEPKPFEAARRVVAALAALVTPGNPTGPRRLALVLVRTLARARPEAARAHLGRLAPAVFASVRDPVIPVKLAAEAAFVELFSVADEQSRVFDKWLAAPGGGGTGGSGGADLPPPVRRSLQDYFRRVALRLGAQVRERREAEGGGDGLGLAADEAEDEKEIWSVGRPDVGGDVFE